MRPNNDDTAEVLNIIRALEREVVDAVWAAVEPLIPPAPEHHPLGCHRPRVADRLCFWGILIRLVTGCSWVSVEAILEYQVSDTTLRARRDEWIAAGVFDGLRKHAVHAYDRIIGLDLSEVALDGSLHKAPCGGEGTGPNPTDRANWAGSGRWPPTPMASRSVGPSTGPTATTSSSSARPSTTSPTPDCWKRSKPCTSTAAMTIPRSRVQLAGRGLDDLNIERRTKSGATVAPNQPLRLGLRWVVEGTNSWLSNYGQLRRNTDRRTHHRHAQLCLVVALLVTAKLIDWRNRWSPESRPIR